MTEVARRPEAHRFVAARVAEVIEETPETRSFVLDVPADDRRLFAYEPGQFVTVRVVVDRTEQRRCYSMSSSPTVDDALKITVKRKPGGVVSNWMHDELEQGATIDVLPPGGRFTLVGGTSDVLAFASGSGITPIMSIVKTLLVTTARKVRLLYANQTRDAVIFAPELTRLSSIYRHRFTVEHHIYDERGFVTERGVRDYLLGHGQPDIYLCGSRHFSATVWAALEAGAVAPDRIHVESFVPGDTPSRPSAPDAADRIGATVASGSVTEEVVIKLHGSDHPLPYVAGDSILRTARRAGLAPPFSCEGGTCASCMAQVVEGDVVMTFNSALTPEEIESGWVLTCQGYPASERAVIEYPE